MSMSSVTSQTDAPSRSSPSWVTDGVHIESTTEVSSIADSSWALARPVTKNETLRSRDVQEPRGASRRVGAHDHLARREHSVVASPMAGADPFGELIDRLVEPRHVVGNGVGTSVARAKDRAQRLAGQVREAEHGWKPNPPF